jgi:hypothetical protein
VNKADIDLVCVSFKLKVFSFSISFVGLRINSGRFIERCLLFKQGFDRLDK